MLAPVFNRANKLRLRLRGGRPRVRTPKHFQSDFASSVTIYVTKSSLPFFPEGKRLCTLPAPATEKFPGNRSSLL
jgi:hypothetical protein